MPGTSDSFGDRVADQGAIEYVQALVLYPLSAGQRPGTPHRRARPPARDELGPLTVGVYTGDSAGGIEMTETSVIGDRYAMRRKRPTSR